MIIISVYGVDGLTRVKLSDNDPDIINLVDYAIGRGFGVHVAKVSLEEAMQLIRSDQEVARVHWLMLDAWLMQNVKIIL